MGKDKDEEFREHTRETLEYISKSIDGTSNRYYESIFYMMKCDVSNFSIRLNRMEEAVNRVGSIDTSIRLMTGKLEALLAFRDNLFNTENGVNYVQGKIDDLSTDMNTLSQHLSALLSEKNNADRELLEKNNRLNGEVDLLKQKIDMYESSLKKLGDDIDNLNIDKDRIQNSLNTANETIRVNEGKIQSLSDELNSSKAQNNRDRDSINDLKVSLFKNNSELEEKNKIISDGNLKIGNLKDKISKLEGTVIELKEKLMLEKDGREADEKKYEAEIEHLHNEIAYIKAENDLKISSLITELKEVSSIKEQLSSRVNSIDSSFDDYKPLLSALRNCPTFSNILSANDIVGNDDVSDLSNLSRLVGNTINFADLIYSTALESKKDSKEYMTNEEAEVYAAVNKCYKKVCNIDYDLFVNPGEQCVTSPYEKVKFNKMEVDNMLDPRKNVLKFSKKIFVPMMKSLTGVLRAKGQVEASNI